MARQQIDQKNQDEKTGGNLSGQPKFQYDASNAASNKLQNYPITELLNAPARHHRNPTVIGNSDVSTSLKYCL